MIQAEVHRNGEVIVSRTYYHPTLTLEQAIKLLETYVVQEMLNEEGECTLRVRFSNQTQAA
jgi:hypothetical protein